MLYNSSGTVVRQRQARKAKPRINGNGYRMVYMRFLDPRANKTPYMLEHRLIMEKALGRQLAKNEIVHHINDIKTDNRIENLSLCESNSYHQSHFHGKKPYWPRKRRNKMITLRIPKYVSQLPPHIEKAVRSETCCICGNSGRIVKRFCMNHYHKIKRRMQLDASLTWEMFQSGEKKVGRLVWEKFERDNNGEIAKPLIHREMF